MVPAAFVSLDKIPLTYNGKLDQRALPAPDRASLWQSQEFVPPRTGTEKKLAEIWSSLLGVERVGVRDRFLDLGGDSLMVLRALSQARESGLPVSLRNLYQYGSIAELAEVIDGAPAAPDGGPHLSGDLPPTPAQRMGLDRAAGGRHDQRQARLLVTAEVDAETLAAALHAVAAHHEALRLRIAPGGRDWRGVIVAAGAAEPVRQVTALPGERLPDAVERAATDLCQRLDVAAGPVLDAAAGAAGPAGPNRPAGRVAPAGDRRSRARPGRRLLAGAAGPTWRPPTVSSPRAGRQRCRR